MVLKHCRSIQGAKAAAASGRAVCTPLRRPTPSAGLITSPHPAPPREHTTPAPEKSLAGADQEMHARCCGQKGRGVP